MEKTQGMNREELLERIRGGRGELEAVLATIDDDGMADAGLPGGWSVKDLLAHIGWWERRIVNAYETLRRSEVPDSVSDAESLDELNAHVFDTHRDWPLAQVRQEEAEAYRALLEVAEKAPEGDLFDQDRFAWTEGRAFFELVCDNSWGHYEEHVPDVKAWLATAS